MKIIEKIFELAVGFCIFMGISVVCHYTGFLDGPIEEIDPRITEPSVLNDPEEYAKTKAELESLNNAIMAREAIKSVVTSKHFNPFFMGE